MYAIVEIQGKQYKVAEKDKIEVDRLKDQKGKITFDKVLLYSKDDKNINIGNPYVKDAKVEAEILEEKKGDKIRVFKMKPKKRYQRTIGHRNNLSVIDIKKITAGSTSGSKSSSKEEE